MTDVILPPDRRLWLERIERNGPQPDEFDHASQDCAKRKLTEMILDGMIHKVHLTPAGRKYLADERERDRISDALRRATAF